MAKELISFEEFQEIVTSIESFEYLENIGVFDTYPGETTEEKNKYKENVKKLIDSLSTKDIKLIEKKSKHTFDKNHILDDLDTYLFGDYYSFSANEEIDEPLDDEYEDDFNYEYNDQYDSEMDYDDAIISKNPTSTKKHFEFNLQNMIKGVKGTLDFCSYDEFTKALEEFKDMSETFKDVYEAMQFNPEMVPSKVVKIAKHVNSLKASLNKAISKLKANEKLELEKYIRQHFNGKLLNYNHIIREFGRRLNKYMFEQIKNSNKKQNPALGKNPLFKNLSPNNLDEEMEYGYSEDDEVLGSPEDEQEYGYDEDDEVLGYPEDEEYQDIEEQKSKKGKFKPMEKKIESQRVNRLSTERATSIVGFIDAYFKTDIINRFSNKFKNINPNDPKYIEKTNDIINEIVEYTYYGNIQNIVSAVKQYYGLELSPQVSSEDLLKELIADELRYYQQKDLKNTRSNNLGNAKLITKEFSLDGRSGLTSFEELNSTTLSNYAFNQEAFNSPFRIVSNNRRLSDDFVSKELTGSHFLEDPANVEIIPSEDGFIVAPKTSSIIR